MMIDFDTLLFDSEFAKANMMGPNSLRIVDELVRNENFEKGMRILDLGCGKGLTSIYLAKKFGATVFATDLWIEASENFERFKSLSLENNIIPIHAEAHQLPFANEYFDAVVSVDAYQYFGFEKDYLPKYLSPLVKKGGKILIGVPGLIKEPIHGIPQELQSFLELDMNFHSCEWWKDLLAQDGSVRMDQCYEMECLQPAWADWLTCENEYAKRDIEMMRAEAGKYFNIVGIKATKV
jgi:cyclopropane fatty-acyl-phospholipid synthase-like methyltransferase